MTWILSRLSIEYLNGIYNCIFTIAHLLVCLHSATEGPYGKRDHRHCRERYDEKGLSEGLPLKIHVNGTSGNPCAIQERQAIANLEDRSANTFRVKEYAAQKRSGGDNDGAHAGADFSLSSDPKINPMDKNMMAEGMLRKITKRSPSSFISTPEIIAVTPDAITITMAWMMLMRIMGRIYPFV